MSNETKDSVNKIVLGLVSPPYIILLISLLQFLLMGGSFGEDAFWREASGHVFRNGFMDFHFPVWLFLIPYPILFYFRTNNNIFWITKLGVCGSTAIAVLGSLERSFDGVSLFQFILLTALFMIGLFWKAEFRGRVDGGPYPLTVDKQGKAGFPTDSLHMNVQVVGGTGTGKTHFVVKPFIEQTIKQDLGCFIYDVKGNMRRDVAFYLKEAGLLGRKGLHRFDIDDPHGSDTYNPLYGDNPDAIANRVFTALYYDTRNSEPYYVELGKAFIHNLVGLLKKEIKTLTFQDLLLATEEADTFRTIQWFCAKHPETPYARYFKHQWLAKPAKQRQEELSGLVTKLQRFCNSEWSHLLNVRNPQIKMDYIVKSNQVFLFCPNATRYPDDAKPLSILAMMDLSEQVADRYRTKPEKPFRVFLDEFYNLAYPRFIDFINKCREAEVNLFLAHQSLGDLRGVSQEFQEQIMNTARNKIVLGVDDPETAEHFARQFGTEEDKNYKVESYKSDGSLAGYSKPQVEKFRFHPNLIKTLKPGQALVKVVGKAGVHVFPVNLKAATPIPADFESRASNARRKWDMVNESSLEQVMKPKPWDKPKPGQKDGGMGDEDAA
jgi:type IV secretory pathway TraG/TraD family ATPase VirD4